MEARVAAAQRRHGPRRRQPPRAGVCDVLRRRRRWYTRPGGQHGCRRRQHGTSQHCRHQQGRVAGRHQGDQMGHQQAALLLSLGAGVGGQTWSARMCRQEDARWDGDEVVGRSAAAHTVRGAVQRGHGLARVPATCRFPHSLQRAGARGDQGPGSGARQRARAVPRSRRPPPPPAAPHLCRRPAPGCCRRGRRRRRRRTRRPAPQARPP